MKPLEVFLYVLCISIALKGGITSELQDQLRILSECLVYAWSIGLVNWLFCGGVLSWFGIRPRTLIGLLGILSSPFLHSNGEHLLGNTVPFFVLGWFVMLEGSITNFFVVTAFVALFSGLGIWVFGQSYTNHIGASGIVFGYLGFLLLRSYVERDPMAIILTATVGFMYGRLLWGVLPIRYGMSWEGHMFGLIGGVLSAHFIDIFKSLMSLN